MTSCQLVNIEILQRFSHLFKTGRMAHAYLLSGPPELGKSETALAVAKMMNCEARLAEKTENFCDRCSPCLKINASQHPDVIVVQKLADADTIKIEQIRELIGRLQMRAFYGGKKVCLIKNIECLTTEGSNALLKTLEEPARDSFLFLTTAVPEENLKTVVSRCHHIKFYGLSTQAVRAQLIKDDGLDPLKAQCLARFTEGSLAKARGLIQSDFFRKKNDAIDNLVFKQDHEPYLKKILGDKAEIREVLTVLLSWFRDLSIIKAGGGQQFVVHTDRYEELLKLEKNYSITKINGIIEEIVGTLKMLGENLNIKIPFILLREKIWVRL